MAIMNRSEYLKAVNEFMYQGEVLGEALFDRYVAMEPGRATLQVGNRSSA